MFEVHIKKLTKSNETIIVICNYCSKEFKWLNSGGYGTYRRYINNAHPIKVGKSKAKGQMQIFRYASANDQLFRYSDTNNKKELACMVAVEHLSFNFGEKVDFVIIVKKH